jgi:PmbA protein
MRWWVAVELIERILAAGGRSAQEVEVYLVEGTGVSAELKREAVATATGSREWGLSIRIIDRGRIGTSATSSPAKWEECLAAALSSMSLTTPQEWRGLPDPADLRRSAPSYDERVVPEPSAAQGFLGGMLEGARKHPESKITSGSGSLARSEVTIANSHGVHYTALRTEVSCSLETICGQSTGSEFAHSPFLEIDPLWVGERAAFFAEHSSKGQPMETGPFDILLSPVALAQLLGNILVPALSGRTVHAGRSRLAPLLGQKCMDGRIDLCDDPFARGMGATAWDAEGVPASRLDFVKAGVLSSFAYDLKTAYRYGAKPTGSAVRGGFSGGPAIGVHNLVLDGPREEIGSERALYVHDVVGAHTANPVSGDFSVECQNPIWVEGGGFQDPVRKAMLSGNLFDALRGIGGIGAGARIVGNSILPCVRFKGMQVIG